MKKYKILITEVAQRDLLGIYRYIEQELLSPIMFRIF